jgi:hypothetical protein
VDRCAAPEECPNVDAHEQQSHQEQTQERPAELDHVDVLRPLQQGIVYPDQAMSGIVPSIPLPPYTMETQTPAMEYSAEAPTQLQAQFQQYESQQAQMEQQQNVQNSTYQGVQNQMPGLGGQQQGQVPWLLEAPLRDLEMDMGGSTGESSSLDDFSWENFDDLVRDVMLQSDSSQVTDRGPSMASLGSWW